MNVLITGAAGFIGSNFVRYLLEKNPDYKITVLDKLTYAGHLENLKGIMDKINFIKGDITNDRDLNKAFKGIDSVIHFAAETHVDNSINDPELFVKTNVFGTFKMLEYSRKHDIKNYMQISTDEVYGSIMKGKFKEDDKFDPSSPYSASKAGGDVLCNSYYKTYGMNVKITRSSNNYGPYQHPEKLIPKTIINALNNKYIPIYGTGKNVRDWIHVSDNCDGIIHVFEKGKSGEVYNIGGGHEHTNVEIAKTILKLLNKPESLIKFVTDRPGHDFRYALDLSKVSKIGWKPVVGFEEGMKRTVNWYVENKWWWAPLLK